MSAYWSDEFGNPSSVHLMGRRAAAAVVTARRSIANLLNCSSPELIFTSGATESNNLLFLGVLLTQPRERSRVVVSAIEHKSILEPARLLKEHGIDVSFIPVLQNGIVDMIAAQELIDSETAFVSVQAANNELGSVQPIAELANLAHDRGAFFHTDAAQALGKINMDLEVINCDFASFSAHKMHGPKGIGALFVRGGARRWPWAHPLLGGGQESGLRPGTVNVPAVVGFGEAARLAGPRMQDRNDALRRLSDIFSARLATEVPNARILTPPDHSLPGTLAVLFPGIPADLLVSRCGSLCISSGAACDGALGGSHVVKQVVADHNLQDQVVRLSFGHGTVVQEFDQFFSVISALRVGE